MSFGGILLGLDDEPACVIDAAQLAQHGDELDRAVARNGEHAVEDRALYVAKDSGRNRVAREE